MNLKLFRTSLNNFFDFRNSSLNTNQFFQKSDSEAPAAYRISLNPSDSSDMERKPYKKRSRKRDEISLSSHDSRVNSSRSSSSSSSSNRSTVSKTSSKKIKKTKKSISNNSTPNKVSSKSIILQPMEISSDENDDLNKQVVSSVNQL